LRRFTNEQARSLSETRALYSQVTGRHRAQAWSQPDAIQRASEAITEIVQEHVELPTFQPLLEALDACQQQLLALETQIFTPIQADLSQPLTLRGQVELNAKLRAQDYFLGHEDQVLDSLTIAIGNLSCAVIQRLSRAAFSPFTVPFISTIDDPGEFIDGIIGIFLKEEHFERNLFTALNQVLYQNLCAASGVSPESESKKPLIWPSAAKLPAVKLVDIYLAGTPLHALMASPCPFTLPDEQRFAGHWTVAPPGRGKTTLLHAMIIDDLSKDAALVVIDSKGDLIDPVKTLACLKDRLLLIEPNPDAAFALNPLDISNTNVTQAVSLIEYIMAGLLDAKFTALQSTLFRNVVPAIIEAIPNPTLNTFKDVMVKGLPTLQNVSPHGRQFFEDRKTGFFSKTYESTRKEVVWRLDYLMTNPILRAMFSASHTKLDMGTQLDAGKVIIINNSKAILGDEGAEFFGRFFVALIARAAQQRAGKPPSAKKPCYVYIDECQSVIAKDTRIPILLDECRSQKIALILAHQRTAQLTSPVLDAVANCAIRMANSDDDAKFLADKLRSSADTLRSLPQGTFATFVRDLTPNGVQLRVSKTDLDSLPKMTEEELTGIRDHMRTTFSSPPPGSTTEEPTATSPSPTVAELPSQVTEEHDAGEPAADWALE
jgi:hypothetical protein